MYELIKIERYLRVNFLGPGLRLTKKVFTGSRSRNIEKHCSKSLSFTPQTFLLPQRLPRREHRISSNCGKYDQFTSKVPLTCSFMPKYEEGIKLPHYCEQTTSPL